MVSESCFEVILCHANVSFPFVVICSNCGFVNEVFCQACTIKRTVRFFSAVAEFSRVVCCFAGREDFRVVVVYYAFHVLHSTVTDFNIPSIEDLVQRAWIRDVFID